MHSHYANYFQHYPQKKMKIELVTLEKDFSEAAEILVQLRPQYSLEAMVAQIKKQQESGYQIACARIDEKMVSVAGFVVCEKLAWGKHIYIDDLVTDEANRSTGAGTALIRWLKAYGAKLGCRQLHLDSGVVRFDAHRFYLRNGFNIDSHHFSIADINS